MHYEECCRGLIPQQDPSPHPSPSPPLIQLWGGAGAGKGTQTIQTRLICNRHESSGFVLGGA